MSDQTFKMMKCPACGHFTFEDHAYYDPSKMQRMGEMRSQYCFEEICVHCGKPLTEENATEVREIPHGTSIVYDKTNFICDDSKCENWKDGDCTREFIYFDVWIINTWFMYCKNRTPSIHDIIYDDKAACDEMVKEKGNCFHFGNFRFKPDGEYSRIKKLAEQTEKEESMTLEAASWSAGMSQVAMSGNESSGKKKKKGHPKWMPYN